MKGSVRIVFITGATGAGKSRLALELAEKTAGVIINLDSIQAYEGLLVGSASPTQEDLDRAPHFLYNFISYPLTTTAGEFRRLALEVIETERVNTNIFFVVSGNGFYSRVLEKGLYPIPKADSRLQADDWHKLSQPGGEDLLYAELVEKDPIVAKRFAAKDHYRLVRALEIIRVMGKPLSQIEKEFAESSESGLPFPFVKLGVGAPQAAGSATLETALTSESARQWLRGRLAQRVNELFERGFIDEVHGLLAKGVSPDWHPLKSAGYAQVVAFLCSGQRSKLNEKDLAKLKTEVLQAHLKMAKKQRTWFSQETGIHWLGATEIERALSIVQDDSSYRMRQSLKWP